MHIRTTCGECRSEQELDPHELMLVDCDNGCCPQYQFVCHECGHKNAKFCTKRTANLLDAHLPRIRQRGYPCLQPARARHNQLQMISSELEKVTKQIDVLRRRLDADESDIKIVESGDATETERLAMLERGISDLQTSIETDALKGELSDRLVKAESELAALKSQIISTNGAEDQGSYNGE